MFLSPVRCRQQEQFASVQSFGKVIPSARRDLSAQLIVVPRPMISRDLAVGRQDDISDPNNVHREFMQCSSSGRA